MSRGIVNCLKIITKTNIILRNDENLTFLLAVLITVKGCKFKMFHVTVNVLLWTLITLLSFHIYTV